MLKVGDSVPDFTLRLALADGSRAPVRFASLLGRGRVVVTFFPLAFTGVCTTQVCELRDAQEALARHGATVVGFSIDAAPANAHFAKLHGMTYGIFSDPNRDVVHRLWETQEVLGVRDCAKRGWMIIDDAGVVRDLWITDDPEEWSGLAPIEAALAR